MAPNFAWDELAEINLAEHHNSDSYEDNVQQFNEYPTRQRQYNKSQQYIRHAAILSNIKSESRTKHLSNEHTYSNAYNVKDCQLANFEPRYSSELFFQEDGSNLQSSAYPVNPVNLIDFIGGNQRT